MVDNYHTDLGEGADLYSAGPTRGVGGSGIWANNQLHVATNFVDSRVLTNGPIRVMFELVYEPFDVNGTQVSKVLRVSLDAGSQLNHFQPSYRAQSPLTVAIGFKKVKDEQRQVNAEQGWVTIWQTVDKNLGMQGLAVVLNPGDVEKLAEDARNNLIVLKPRTSFPLSYWAGFDWDRAGRNTSHEAWKKYVDEFAERLRSPIELTVK